MDNTNLDSLVVNEGQEFNENEQQIINVGNEKRGELLYDDFGPLPGVKTEILHEEVTEETAENKITEMAAIMKLQKEQEAFHKMTDNEKIKDYVLQSQYYYQTNEWFKKYGYDMTGKQKRNLKRDLERAWNKGKFKLTPEQRQDILFELGKASNVRKQIIESGQTQPAQPQQNKETAAEHIADLNQLIFK